MRKSIDAPTFFARDRSQRLGRAPLGSVIIFAAEDGAADTVVPRLLAAGANLQRVHIVSAVRDGAGHRAFNLAEDLTLLEQKIRQAGNTQMVVIDPISSYLGARVDSHVNAAVRGALEPVSEMADRLRVAIVSVTHPPKATGTTAINRFIGSIAFVAAARAAFMVTRDADDKNRRLFLPVKNNLAPLGAGLAFKLEQRIVAEPGIVTSYVVWDTAPVAITADQALAATDAVRDGAASRRDEAEEFLRDKLSAGPVPVKDVEEHARALGITKRTLERARKTLEVSAVKNDFGGGWSLALPDEDRQNREDRPKTATSGNGGLRENSSASPAPQPVEDSKPVLGSLGDSSDDFGPWVLR